MILDLQKKPKTLHVEEGVNPGRSERPTPARSPGRPRRSASLLLRPANSSTTGEFFYDHKKALSTALT